MQTESPSYLLAMNPSSFVHHTLTSRKKSFIKQIVADVAAAADMHEQRDNPEAHAALLNNIQRFQLAAEKPTETAKRILYQMRLSLVVTLSEALE